MFLPGVLFGVEVLVRGLLLFLTCCWWCLELSWLQRCGQEHRTTNAVIGACYQPRVSREREDLVKNPLWLLLLYPMAGVFDRVESSEVSVTMWP